MLGNAGGGSALKDPALDPSQLSRLEAALHRGSAHASEQLGKWLGRSSIIELDALRVSPIAEATELLTAGDDPICFCHALEVILKVP